MGIAINTDGGRVNGCGGVIREEHDRWLGGFTRYLGEANSYVAALWGVL